MAGSQVSRARVSEAEGLLAEIERLYRQIEALPGSEKPSTSVHANQASPQYLALETRIRTLADQYKALTRRPRRAGTIHSTADP